MDTSTARIQPGTLNAKWNKAFPSDVCVEHLTLSLDAEHRANGAQISPQVSISEEHIRESLALWAKTEEDMTHGYVFRSSLNVRNICAKRYAVLKDGRLLLYKNAGMAWHC